MNTKTQRSYDICGTEDYALLMAFVFAAAMASRARTKSRSGQTESFSNANRRSCAIGIFSASSASVPLYPSSTMLPIRRFDIGDYIGIHPETLSRAMAGLAETGLIELVARESRIAQKSSASAPRRQWRQSAQIDQRRMKPWNWVSISVAFLTYLSEWRSFD